MNLAMDLQRMCCMLYIPLCVSHCVCPTMCLPLCVSHCVCPTVCVPLCVCVRAPARVWKACTTSMCLYEHGLQSPVGASEMHRGRMPWQKWPKIAQVRSNSNPGTGGTVQERVGTAPGTGRNGYWNGVGTVTRTVITVTRTGQFPFSSMQGPKVPRNGNWNGQERVPERVERERERVWNGNGN